MLYELFLIMVFGFIIYHFYINVTNYLNIGTPFVEGMKLMNKGWSPKLPSGTKLKKCEGDCDRNTDCEKGLKCFQRRKKEKVPGCESGGTGDKKGIDFCYDPKDIKAKWPRWPGMRNLVDMGGSMQKVPKGQKLKECEGDCDKDADCVTGLKCYQRSNSVDQVPGCKIGGKGDIGSHDYCYDPKKKQQKKWDNSMWNNKMRKGRQQRRQQISQQPSSYSLNDSSTSTFQRIVPNKQQTPSTSKIVSKEVIVQVLKNKKLILGGYNIKTYDYNTNIGVGKRFITEMSIVRNLAVPKTIEDTEYATIGKNVIHVVNKKQPRHQNILIRNLKTILGGNRLASSSIDSSTTPQMCTSKKTTGMFNNNCTNIFWKRLRDC